MQKYGIYVNAEIVHQALVSVEKAELKTLFLALKFEL